MRCTCGSDGWVAAASYRRSDAQCSSQLDAAGMMQSQCAMHIHPGRAGGWLAAAVAAAAAAAAAAQPCVARCVRARALLGLMCSRHRRQRWTSSPTSKSHVSLSRTSARHGGAPPWRRAVAPPRRVTASPGQSDCMCQRARARVCVWVGGRGRRGQGDQNVLLRFLRGQGQRCVCV